MLETFLEVQTNFVLQTLRVSAGRTVHIFLMFRITQGLFVGTLRDGFSMGGYE